MTFLFYLNDIFISSLIKHYQIWRYRCYYCCRSRSFLK